MIWCFGFFLELLDDCDEESQQQSEALASLDDVGRKLGSVPTTLVQTQEIIHLPLHQPQNYPPKLDCHTLALQGMSPPSPSMTVGVHKLLYSPDSLHYNNQPVFVDNNQPSCTTNFLCQLNMIIVHFQLTHFLRELLS